MSPETLKGTNNSAWARYKQTIKQFKTFIIFPKIFTKYVSYIWVGKVIDWSFWLYEYSVSAYCQQLCTLTRCACTHWLCQLRVRVVNCHDVRVLQRLHRHRVRLTFASNIFMTMKSSRNCFSLFIRGQIEYNIYKKMGVEKKISWHCLCKRSQP